MARHPGLPHILLGHRVYWEGWPVSVTMDCDQALDMDQMGPCRLPPRTPGVRWPWHYSRSLGKMIRSANSSVGPPHGGLEYRVRRQGAGGRNVNGLRPMQCREMGGGGNYQEGDSGHTAHRLISNRSKITSCSPQNYACGAHPVALQWLWQRAPR